MKNLFLYMCAVLIWGSTWYAIKFQLGKVDPMVSIGSLLYLSIFGSVIAFGCYLTLIGNIGPDKSAYATLIIPLIALEISTLFEGYRWSGLAVIGIVLILAGNLLVMGQKLRR